MSSDLPPLLHPLPTPLSLKFCDQIRAVRTQTHNLSNSESPNRNRRKKNTVEKGYISTRKRKKKPFVNGNFLFFKSRNPWNYLFFTTPRQQSEGFQTDYHQAIMIIIKYLKKLAYQRA
jgi:hypothetical protein